MKIHYVKLIFANSMHVEKLFKAYSDMRSLMQCYYDININKLYRTDVNHLNNIHNKAQPVKSLSFYMKY